MRLPVCRTCKGQVPTRVSLGGLVHGLILGLAEKDFGCIMSSLSGLHGSQIVHLNLGNHGQDPAQVNPVLAEAVTRPARQRSK